MQPLDGYRLVGNMEEIIRVLNKKCVDTISFANGEIIADIGAGNGYIFLLSRGGRITFGDPGLL